MGGGGGGGGRRSGQGRGGAPAGRGGWAGLPSGSAKDICETLRFDTALMSPQQAITNLSVGDVLTLRLGQQQNRPIVEAIDNSGALLGTITSAQIAQLIDCMQRGHRFVAEVVRIVSGTCRVTVHHQ